MFEANSKSMISELKTLGIKDHQVLEVMSRIPRHFFVNEALAHQAYRNIALPIGDGQTISQPYIVAKMTELLAIKPTDTILEIGTGSGYQTAILASLSERVYSIERIKNLQWQAKRRLKNLDLHNVSTRHSDGWEGWQERGPYQAIIVTASAYEVPKALLSQLANGGRMVIPVGEEKQVLQLIHRQADQFKVQHIESVNFVPLVKNSLV